MAALDLVVAQVLEMRAVTDPYHPVEHQDLHQVALEAALQLDSPASVSPGLKVTASATVASPDMPTSAPDTSVTALALADLDSAVSVGTER